MFRTESINQPNSIQILTSNPNNQTIENDNQAPKHFTFYHDKVFQISSDLSTSTVSQSSPTFFASTFYYYFYVQKHRKLALPYQSHDICRLTLPVASSVESMQHTVLRIR